MRFSTFWRPWLLLVVAVGNGSAIDQLRVIYKWKQMEYDWPNEETKSIFSNYKQEDNLPLGLEVAGDRIFITVPRWKRGVVSSLNYININDSRTSPPLIPYPSWESHQYSKGLLPEIVSTFRVRADRCYRLWVLDTGLVDILGSPEQQAPPTLLVYDLTNDQLLRKYPIPDEQRTADSLFANIAVEDYSCEDSYAYLGDLGGPGLVVYSWKLAKSWIIKHHYFYPDPQSGVFNVGGVDFHWSDGIFGLALAPTGDGFSTLYFHPLTSTMEFSVSTRILRDFNRIVASETFHQFQVLGSRGSNGQSSVSFLDPDTGILIYALTNLNAIACWQTGTKYSIQQQGRVYMNNVTMVFPNDIKIDRNGTIWVLSDRLPTFMYQQLDPSDYNFRILAGNIREAVQGTICSVGISNRKTPPSTNSKDFGNSNRPNQLPSQNIANLRAQHSPATILGLTIVLRFLSLQA
ncbi:PREDICTED: protein yellow [Ceratosolen solmsi marchali]|uniref:Protein yellow n=1 Tax=Ceratosolen solmsi marchali TaxID=326594 RepID=A0AAJ6YXR1_9HYME|nr:PREDICTED: protein yellow [Ceratosolen solmsi marchali]